MTCKKRKKSIADSSITDILNSPESVAAHRQIRFGLFFLERVASLGDVGAKREIEMIKKL